MFGYRLSAYFSRRRGLLAFCWAIVFVFAALTIISALNKKLDSALASYVEVTLDSIISSAVNGAVLDEISGGDYSGLVSLTRDRDGRIASIETDAPRVNRLKASVALRALERLERPDSREITVPLGTLLGGRLFLGRGPGVTVRLTAAGAANTAVASEFKSAGINQTLHRMILEIDIDITAVMPGSVALHRREKQVVLGETVIVGVVPDSYTYIDDTRDGTLDKVLDYQDE